MQKETNLKDYFKISGITETDILTYFQQGDSHAEKGIYYFLGDQVKVEFNNRGKIKNINGSLDSPFVQRAIKELNEISQESDLEMGRVVIQGISPMNGFYKHKEILQISPLKSIPTHIKNGISKFPYPFLLEYKYRTSKNSRIRIQRMLSAKEEILFVLNLLIYGGVSDVNINSNQSIWVDSPTEWREPTPEEIDILCEYKRPVSGKRTNMYLTPGYRLDTIDSNNSIRCNLKNGI